MTTQTIFSDDGGNRLGSRTRLFRDGSHGGVEWMFAVDYAAGSDRWYGFGMDPGNSTAKMIGSGFYLVEFDTTIMQAA